MSDTDIILLALGADTVLWLMLIVASKLAWALARRETARNNVVQAMLEKVRGGQEVSDADVAGLVEQTGAPAKIVLKVLNTIAGRRSTGWPPSQS